jgi:HK97 family phage major capsid protein
MALGDFSGVIPPEQSSLILAEATRVSAALQLATTLPMGSKVTQMPVPKTFPTASFVTAANGRKPYTDIGLQPATLTAEEVAAVIGIPDAMVEDSTINLWNYCRPLLAQAIARALDDAIIFGLTPPASYPVGGVLGRAVGVNAGTDVVDTINKTMGQVESQQLDVTGSCTAIVNRQLLRGVRASGSGEMLLGAMQIDNYTVPTLFGLPIAYIPWHYATGAAPATYIAGNWKYLVVGIRQDIRYEINPAGVIADSAGVVIVSGFQDNVTPMKVWARFGCVLIDPVTPDKPAGAKAFAKSALGATSGTAPTATEGDEGEAASSEADEPRRSAKAGASR